MKPTFALAVAALLTLTGCGASGGGDPAPMAPDYTPIQGSPAPANARLYAGCIRQAAEAGTYDRVHDDGTEVIRFTCAGAPARAFYDGLAAWSAENGTEHTVAGRTYRATNPIQQNLFGADFCWADGSGGYGCEMNFNAGDFLAYGG